MRRNITYLLTTAVAAALLGAASAQTGWTCPEGFAGQTLSVYNWSTYIAEDTIANFEEACGVRVIYDTYATDDDMLVRLRQGNPGFDVVVPSDVVATLMIAEGLLEPLDHSRIPNLANVDPTFLDLPFDPGNRYTVPYQWGTTGIGYNAVKIAERMPNAPTDSLKLLFDPEVVKRFADCGVTVLDDAAELFPAALKYLGLDPDSKQAADLEKAEAALMAIRPYIRKFHSSQYIEDLANGDVCLAFGWSGDIVQAKARAEEAKNGVQVVYKIPREGAQMWFDSFAIPKDAPHPAEAHAFIDYMMRPDVIARCTNAVSYPNGNKDADALVDPAIKQDPEIYPPAERIETLFTISPYTQRQQTQLNRMWTRIKAGR